MTEWAFEDESNESSRYWRRPTFRSVLAERPQLAVVEAAADPFERVVAWTWDADAVAGFTGEDRDRQWSILDDFGTLGLEWLAGRFTPGSTPARRDVAPSIPARFVRVVLSYFERGTASQLAWNWLARTEADDDAVVAAIGSRDDVRARATDLTVDSPPRRVDTVTVSGPDSVGIDLDLG